MATYATRAIIIGRYNFGEADRVLVLLTPDRGIIRAVAKSVRKIKSRLAGHLELFSESDLMLAEGRSLDVVTAARLQHHLATGDDYERMRLAYLMAEMVNRLGGETQPYEGLFELVQTAFVELAAGRADPTLELWFKLRLLDRLGYRPELGSCMICGTADPQRSYHFNVELGGIVDQGCTAVSGSPPFSHDAIKLWRLILAHPVARIRSIAAAPELATATLPICNAFYDYTFGKRFRSSEVLT